MSDSENDRWSGTVWTNNPGEGTIYDNTRFRGTILENRPSSDSSASYQTTSIEENVERHRKSDADWSPGYRKPNEKGKSRLYAAIFLVLCWLALTVWAETSIQDALRHSTPQQLLFLPKLIHNTRLIFDVLSSIILMIAVYKITFLNFFRNFFYTLITLVAALLISITAALIFMLMR